MEDQNGVLLQTVVSQRRSACGFQILAAGRTVADPTPASDLSTLRLSVPVTETSNNSPDVIRSDCHRDRDDVPSLGVDL